MVDIVGLEDLEGIAEEERTNLPLAIEGLDELGKLANQKDARDGELGIHARNDGSGGVSTELSITVTDPRLNQGRATNIPLLVKGQTGVDVLLATPLEKFSPTRQQEEIAILRAIQRQSEGQYLPSYATIDEAVEVAQKRSSNKEAYREPGTTAAGLTKAVVRGASNSLLEFLDFGASLVEGSTVQFEPGTKGIPVIDPETGEMVERETSITRASGAAKEEIEKLQQNITRVWGQANSGAEGIVEGITQFYTIGGAASQVGKVAGMTDDFIRWMAAGAVADVTAFDPFAPNLSSWLLTFNNPVANNVLTEWLATDSSDRDAEFENRFKRAIEGGILGILTNALLKTAQVSVAQIRAKRGVRQVAKQHNSNRRIAGLSDIESSPDVVVTHHPKGAVTAREELFQVDELDNIRAQQPGGPRKATQADIASMTKDQLEGRDVVNLTVKAKNGKPVEIISGEEVIDLVHTVGSKRVKVRVIDEVDQARIDADAEVVQQVHSSARQARAQEQKRWTQSVKRALSSKSWIDFSGQVKAKLLKEGGDAGREAVRKLELVAGATPRAEQRYQAAAVKVWKGLNTRESNLLDEMIDSYRSAQIDFTNVGGRKQKLPGGVTGKQHANRLLKLQQGDPKLYRKLRERANIFFNEMRGQLDELERVGLITKQSKERLARFDFTPREYIELIDPINEAATVAARKANRGSAIQVGDSGIAYLRGGSESFNNLNQAELLQHVITRTQNRIARNTANQSLFKVAKQGKIPGLVSLKKGKNTAKVRVVVDGKRQTMHMPQELADQWTGSTPIIWEDSHNMIRVLSGSAVLRPLATGVNPEFALINFPRDIAHIYMATPREVGFSTVPFKYFAQMGDDLAQTASDAWFRKGAFREFIEEGGGMSFLTHQGQDIFHGAARKSGQAMFANNGAWERTKAFLGYLNETSEVWARLALRNRALKQGMTAEEATWQARRYLDFAQGGLVTKNLDVAVPYINAATQATRTGLREAFNDPGRFLQKVGWVAGTSAAVMFANKQMYPELYDELPDEVWNRYWVFGMPFKIRDVNGLPRRAYVRLKKDETMSLLSSLTDMVTIQELSGRPVDKEFWNSVRESLPNVVDNFIPTYNAYKTYVENYDNFTKRNVWWETNVQSREIRPEAEIRQDFRADGRIQTPTSQLAIDIADLVTRGSRAIPGFERTTGVSPARLEAAYSKIAPRNIYTDLMGRGYQVMTNSVPEEVLRRSPEEAYFHMPGMRRVIALSHPDTVSIRRATNVAQGANTEEFQQYQQLDEFLGKMTRGDISQETIVNYIGKQDPVTASNMLDKFKRMLEINTRRNEINFDAPQMPQLTWWARTLGMSPKARAEVYYDFYMNAEPATQRAMDNAASVIKGYGSKDFRVHLNSRRETGLHGER